MMLARFQQSWAGRTKLVIVAWVAASLGTLGHAEPAVPPRPASRGTVEFAAAVNADFRRLPKLDAWQNTATVVRKTLTEWYPPQVRGFDVENGDHDALRGFFTRLGNAASADWSIVYLGSHQNMDGLWFFPHDSPQSWPEMLAGTTARIKPPRFVVIDACYAEAADSMVVMRGTGAAGVLYAANRTEVVHELNFHQRFPIDLTRQYAAEAKWLRETLGPKWNGRISFLGFIWLRAHLTTRQAPENLGDWNAFFRLCENFAGEFRHGRGESLATTIHYVPRPQVDSH